MANLCFNQRNVGPICFKFVRFPSLMSGEVILLGEGDITRNTFEAFRLFHDLLLYRRLGFNRGDISHFIILTKIFLAVFFV